MNNKAAISNIYKDTILGVIIGWGGFTKLFPNLLESLASVTDLGSYIALRIFSIFFFLLILIIVVTYWWGRGLEIYFKKISGHKLLKLKYKKSLSALSLVLKLAPIAIFINNQFFIYALKFNLFGIWPIEFNFIDWILWYYLVLAIGELLLVSKFIDKVNGIKLLKANTLIFSLDVVLGIGLVCFIEPWAFYKSEFIWQTVSVGLIYALVAFAIYIRIRNKNNANILQFKQFGISLFVVVFLVSVFPSVNFQKWAGMTGLVFIFLLLLSTIIYSVVKAKHNIRDYTSLIIGISTFLTAGLILLSVYSAILEKVNKKYFENRIKASDKISKSKIFPLIAFDDSLKYINGVDLFNDKLDDPETLANCLADNNHKWAYFKKLGINGSESNSFTGCDSIANINWINLSKENNVRNIFFNQYVKLSEANKKNIVADQDSINAFYDGVYTYIHKDIIKKYVVPLLSNGNAIPEKLRDYLHPINYYTETLEHYKKQHDDAITIVALNNEIGGFEVLQRHTQLESVGLENRINDKKETIDDLFNNISELQNTNYQSLVSGNLHNDVVNDTDSTSAEEKNYKSSKLNSFFRLIEQYKWKQYQERYRKAQIIFHVYLKDSQRVGTYILIYTLLMAGFLYWFYITDELKSDNTAQNESDEPLDTPNRFINILILSVIVILIYIARPIEPENIDPENPQWMMNLENWYNDASVFDVTFQEHEDNTTHSSSIGNKELLMVLKSIESKLDTDSLSESDHDDGIQEYLGH